MHRFYTTDFPRPVIASYSKLVDAAANSGDAVARNLIVNAAQQLATAVSAVRMQLFERGEHAKAAYIGGVFKSEMLRERFRCWWSSRTAIPSLRHNTARVSAP